jgi:Ca2+/Na+ antiporter
MEPAAIRSRLRVVRSVFLWVVVAAVAFVSWAFGLTLVALILAAVVVVLVIYRIAREASVKRTHARADQTRIDQTSAGNSAGFTSIGVGGVVLQILLVIVIDALIAWSVTGIGHFNGRASVLVSIAGVLTVFVIVVAALTFRLRSLQRQGMAALASKA